MADRVVEVALHTGGMDRRWVVPVDRLVLAAVIPPADLAGAIRPAE